MNIRTSDNYYFAASSLLKLSDNYWTRYRSGIKDFLEEIQDIAIEHNRPLLFVASRGCGFSVNCVKTGNNVIILNNDRWRNNSVICVLNIENNTLIFDSSISTTNYSLRKNGFLWKAIYQLKMNNFDIASREINKRSVVVDVDDETLSYLGKVSVGYELIN